MTRKPQGIAETDEQEIYDEVSDAVIPSMQEWIDERHQRTGVDRRLIAAEVGRALALAGFSFAGAAGNLPADAAIDACKEGLAKLKSAILAHNKLPAEPEKRNP